MTRKFLRKTATTLVAAGTSNAAEAATRAVIDLREADASFVSLKITNGATGPTVQCTAKLLAAFTNGATPAAGAEGATWKAITNGVLNGGTTANAVSTLTFAVDRAVQHLEVEFAGNTVQPVTVEAFISTIIDEWEQA